jgi:hypothetical protein
MAESPKNLGFQMHEEIVDDAGPGERPAINSQVVNEGHDIWEEIISEGSEPILDPPPVVRDATPDDLHMLVSEYGVSLHRLLVRWPEVDSRLSVALDPPGPRIKVSVRPRAALWIPRELCYPLPGLRLRVKVERAEDY